MLFSIFFFFSPKADKDWYASFMGKKTDPWGITFLKGTKASEVGLDEAQAHLHLILEESSLLDVSRVPHPSPQPSSTKHFAFADTQQCPSLTGLIRQLLIQLTLHGCFDVGMLLAQTQPKTQQWLLLCFKMEW